MQEQVTALEQAEVAAAAIAGEARAWAPLPDAAALKAQAEGVLRSRLVYEGTRLDLSDASSAPWWQAQR